MRNLKWCLSFLCLLFLQGAYRVPAERVAGICVGRRAQVELHRDDGWGIRGKKRDVEGGVVTLGAGAGRCPGPATAAEVENQDFSVSLGACAPESRKKFSIVVSRVQ